MFHPASHTMFIFILRCHGGGRMCTRTSAFMHALSVREFPSVAKTTDTGGINVLLFYVLSLCFTWFYALPVCMAPSWFHLTFPTRLYFLVLSLKSNNLSLVLERDGLMAKITYALVEDLSLVLSTYTIYQVAHDSLQLQLLGNLMPSLVVIRYLHSYAYTHTKTHHIIKNKSLKLFY